MAGKAAAWRELRRFDSIIAALQVLAQNALAFLASGIGAAVMGYLASITSWADDFGPLGLGIVGLVSFIALLLTFTWIRRWLAAGRRDRAAALIAEQVADRSTVNPMEKHFRNQRIHVQDLLTPYGDGLDDRTFVDCELIGPAIILLDHGTVIRKNKVHYVEYICVDPERVQIWPNKLTLFRSIIENCRLYNIVFLVPMTSKLQFEATFSDKVPWANPEWIHGLDDDKTPLFPPPDPPPVPALEQQPVTGKSGQ